MPDTYLTSPDMTLIERVLLESRKTPEAGGYQTIEARFLVECFKEGMTGEDDLRRALRERATIADASPMPDPGTISSIYRILVEHRNTSIGRV